MRHSLHPPRGFLTILVLMAGTLVAGHARATVAYIHEIKGKAKYKARKGRGWGPLPPNLLVHAGDQLRLKAGDRARIVYLGRRGRSRLLRGPTRVTIRGPRGRRATAARGRTPFTQLLKLLITRTVSYHRQGQSTLATASPNRLDLLSPRYSVVRPVIPQRLRWRRKARHKRYRVAVWRYTANFKEQRTSGVVTCATAVCEYTIPASYPLVPGQRYYWNVRILGAGTKPYPMDGVWFSLATGRALTALQGELTRARRSPAASRTLQETIAWAKHGFHQRALGRIPGTPRGDEKALKARLLCITCRPGLANRLAGKSSFCRCKEEPDRP